MFEVDHEEVFKRYLTGTWPAPNESGNIQVSCPFHTDKSPSFSFHPKQGTWKCFSCDRHGNTTELVAEMEHVDTKEAYRMIEEWQSKPERKGQVPETTESYAAAKGLNEELLRQYGLSNTIYAGVQCVRIPYYDANSARVATRFRFGKDSEKRFKWASGDTSTLYGVWLRKSLFPLSKKIILVEGESDCHALWQNGFPAYGVPGATNFKDDFVDLLEGFEKVFIHVEPDNGGQKFLAGVTSALKRKGFQGAVFSFSVNNLYPDCKDPSDLFKKEQSGLFKDKMRDAINNCTTIDLSAAEEPAPEQEAPAEPEKQHKFHSLVTYRASDLENMDISIPTPAVAWMCPVGTSLLYAQPKKGKSFLAMQACLAVCNGEPLLGMPVNKGSCLYLDLESSQAREKTRLIRMLAGSPMPKTLHICHASDTIETGLTEAIQEAQEQINNNTPEDPLRLVVIDTLAFVKDSATGNDNAYEADIKMLKPLEQFAHQSGLCILLIHHAKKGSSGSDLIEGHSGSQGIVGIVDCICRLDGDRHADMKLEIKPRDADDSELMLRVDQNTSMFTLVTGASEEYLKRKEHNEKPVTPLIRMMMRDTQSWEGTPTQLFDYMVDHVDMPPQFTPATFATAVKDEADAFREFDGISIYNGRTKKSRTIKIRKGNQGQQEINDFAIPVTDLTPFEEDAKYGNENSF